MQYSLLECSYLVIWPFKSLKFDLNSTWWPVHLHWYPLSERLSLPSIPGSPPPPGQRSEQHSSQGQISSEVPGLSQSGGRWIWRSESSPAGRWTHSRSHRTCCYNRNLIICVLSTWGWKSVDSKYETQLQKLFIALVERTDRSTRDHPTDSCGHLKPLGTVVSRGLERLRTILQTSKMWVSFKFIEKRILYQWAIHWKFSFWQSSEIEFTIMV